MHTQTIASVQGAQCLDHWAVSSFKEVQVQRSSQKYKPTVQPIGQWQFPVTGWQFPWFWHWNTTMTMGMMITISTWQEEVQLAPCVPGGQGSSQRAPLHPARQLQPPDFGSQNPPDRRICKFFKKWEKFDLRRQ